MCFGVDFSYTGIISDNEGKKLYERAKIVGWEAKSVLVLAFCN